MCITIGQVSIHVLLFAETRCYFQRMHKVYSRCYVCL